jgi:hypothetical protein
MKTMAIRLFTACAVVLMSAAAQAEGNRIELI